MKRIFILLILGVCSLYTLGAEEKFFEDLELGLSVDANIYNDAVGYGGTLGVMTDAGGSSFLKNMMLGVHGKYRGAMKDSLGLNSYGGGATLGYQMTLPAGLRFIPLVQGGIMMKSVSIETVSTNEVEYYTSSAITVDFPLGEHIRIGVDGGYNIIFAEQTTKFIDASLLVSYVFNKKENN